MTGHVLSVVCSTAGTLANGRVRYHGADRVQICTVIRVSRRVLEKIRLTPFSFCAVLLVGCPTYPIAAMNLYLTHSCQVSEQP
jgi:hypothetical protein